MVANNVDRLHAVGVEGAFRMAMQNDQLTVAGRFWDRYVDSWEESGRRGEQWPGDEWGTPDSCTSLVHALFAEMQRWRSAVEIGSGSGKYTEWVLGNSPATVAAFDVSPKFLAICERRCSHAIATKRLSLHLLRGAYPAEMLDALLEAGYRRTLDAVFAIDVMVHVPLQDLVTYAITAALALRPGGKFIFTAADATSERGFTKLVGDIRWTYQDQRDPVGGQPLGAARFQWMSPQLVETVLERLGFTVQIDPGLHRDLWVVATLADSSRGDRFEAALRSTRARTLVHRP